ncbi:MAG: hypothetical protein ABEJ73_03830 [Haloplanus sp.]
MNTRSHLVLVLSLLLVGSGCAAPTDRPASPPGISDGAVTDANALVRAHTDALQSQSFTVRSTTTMHGPDGNYRVVNNRTWRIDPTGTVRGAVVSTSTIIGDAPARYARRPETVAAWRAGPTTYRRVERNGETTYRRVALFNSSVKLSAAIQRQAVYRLNTRRNATVESITRDGTRLYRVTAPLNDTAVTTNASMTLLVDANGVVRRLETTQTVQYRSGKREITRIVEFTDTGATTVERPDWYTHAVDATGQRPPDG